MIVDKAREALDKVPPTGGKRELMGGCCHLLLGDLWNPEEDAEQLCREFVELHYREAAPPILEYLEMLHDNAENKGVHPNCFPLPADVGLDAEVARRGLAFFETAGQLAGDDQVRARVEKASISAYKALIAVDGAVEGEERSHLIERYVALCRRFGMTHAAEHRLVDDYFAELGVG